MKNQVDKEIIDELKELTHDKVAINKAQKRMKIVIWAILICNFLAGCFIGSIYFIIGDIIFLIIGIVLILLDIPAYILLNKFVERINFRV